MENNKKFLITGAPGWLCNTLVKVMYERKINTRCLVLKGMDTEYLEKLCVEIVFGNVLDYNSLLSATEGIEKVIHAVGIIHPKKAKIFYQINTQGTENIIEDKVFQLDNFQVTIQGSIKNIDFDQIDYFYLFLNDQPFAKIVDLENSQNNLILWRVVFLSGYIPDGCHDFSLGLIDGTSKFISLDQVEFCKTE